jgi:hypothetical protein
MPEEFCDRAAIHEAIIILISVRESGADRAEPALKLFSCWSESSGRYDHAQNILSLEFGSCIV